MQLRTGDPKRKSQSKIQIEQEVQMRCISAGCLSKFYNQMDLKFEQPNELDYQALSNQNHSKVKALLKSGICKISPQNAAIESYLTLFPSPDPDGQVISQSQLPEYDRKVTAQFANYIKKIPGLDPALIATLRKEKFLAFLITFRKFINDQGGFQFTLSHGLFKGIVTKMIQNLKLSPLPSETQQTYFQYYKEMIYPFDLYQTQGFLTPQKVGIGFPEFISSEIILRDHMNKVEKLFEKEVFCVPNVISDSKVRNGMFYPEKINAILEKCESLSVTLLSPLCKNSKTKTSLIQMTGRQYVDYSNGAHHNLPRELQDQLAKQTILQMQPKCFSSHSSHLQQLQKLPLPLIFQNPFNSLHNPTIQTFSPLSLQIISPNSYRPINSQSLSKCCLVDINHGGADYVWTVVNFSYFQEIRDIILKSSNVDIEITPVLPDHTLLMLNRIPVKQIVQKQGSCVFINSGVLFWGESRGKSIHSTWQILPLTKRHFQKLMTLNEMQPENKFPIKSLSLSILNSLYYLNPGLTSYLLDLSTKWIKRERFRRELMLKNSTETLQTVVSYDMGLEVCSVCHEEIFCIKYIVKEGSSWCYKCFENGDGTGRICDSSLLLEGFIARVRVSKEKQEDTDCIVPQGTFSSCTVKVKNAEKGVCQGPSGRVLKGGDKMVCEDNKEQEVDLKSRISRSGTEPMPSERVKSGKKMIVEEGEIVSSAEGGKPLMQRNERKNPSYPNNKRADDGYEPPRNQRREESLGPSREDERKKEGKSHERNNQSYPQEQQANPMKQPRRRDGANNERNTQGSWKESRNQPSQRDYQENRENRDNDRRNWNNSSWKERNNDNGNSQRDTDNGGQPNQLRNQNSNRQVEQQQQGRHNSTRYRSPSPKVGRNKKDNSRSRSREYKMKNRGEETQRSPRNRNDPHHDNRNRNDERHFNPNRQPQPPPRSNPPQPPTTSQQSGQIIKIKTKLAHSNIDF